MTLLTIEVKTVTGKYHPEDMVKIWAPHLRPNGDAVVSTAPEIVKLVQGYAEVELIPGPARIQIMCGGTLDNAVRKVTIPDAATATLRAVLEDGFDWEPEIVTEVRRYRNDAVAASTSATEAAAAANSDATTAQEAATAAETSAEEAATAVSTAASGAIQEVHDAVAADRTLIEGYKNDAAGSATTAQQAATTASTSASNAATSATNAATSAGEAATHEDASLDAAAAAIAAAVSVAQFQGHGFPDGVVKAPVGSIYTDLDATNGAIRWIKTSGTGNTGWKVEYGDTGWRTIAPEGSTGRFLVQRIGTRVSVELVDFEPPTLPGTPGSVEIFELPNGFRASNRNIGLITRANSIAEMHRLWVESTRIFVVPGTTNILTWDQGVRVRGSITYETSQPWPSVLPGTPA